MRPPTPRQVPFELAKRHPGLQVLASNKVDIVHGLIAGATGFADLVSSASTQGPPAKDSGWARLQAIVLTSGKPATDPAGNPVSRLRLTDETLAALTPVVAAVQAAVLADEALRNVLWTVLDGVAAGVESGGATAPDWSLAPLATTSGLALRSASYDGARRRLELSCFNALPRHLGVYVEFLQAGRPLTPGEWKSRLPAGVPASLESATQKYLGVFAPNVSVAGLVLPGDPQPLRIDLPDGAETVELVFGGVGNGNWDPLTGAAGALLTFVLDCALPTIIDLADGDTTDGWYREIVADAAVRAAVIGAAAAIVLEPSITDSATLLAWLAVNLDALLLGDELAALRKTIDHKLGAGAVANAAPILGWPARTLAALLAAPAPAYSPLGAVASTFALRIGTGAAVTVQATLAPDAQRRDWPDGAQTYELVASYGDGFSRRLSAAVPADPPGAAISATFPSVRTGAPIVLVCAVRGATGKLLASGSSAISAAPDATGGVVSATIQVLDEPVIVTPATTFTRTRTLRCDVGVYAWGPPSASDATQRSLSCSPGTNSLCELVNITLQAATSSVGYTWRTTDTGVQDCASSSPTTIAYTFQNVGMLEPAAELKTIACGFAGQPCLAYGPRHAVYLDPRSPEPHLRPVAIGTPGPFDLTGNGSLGRFRAPDLTAVVLHPAGYAIGVSATANRVEIVALSATPTTDGDAPVSRVVAGPGMRAGLVGAPVSCAAGPSGVVLVLEARNARLQAIDVDGDPVPMFSGSPLAPLKPEIGVAYMDLAISPAGLIYVLSSINGGATVGDYRLDVYDAGGGFLTRTNGINAARIAVDAAERVYTLDYTAIKGGEGRTEPAVSRWAPS